MNGDRNDRMSGSNVNDLRIFEVMAEYAIIVILFELVARPKGHIPYCGFNDGYPILYLAMMSLAEVDL